MDNRLDKFLMRKSNRKLVFSAIHKKGSISRVQIANMTHMSLMTVGRIVDELVNIGIVVEEDSNDMTATLGRRPKLLHVASNNFLSVGVEIDRDGIYAGIINLQGKVLKKMEQKYNCSGQTAEIVLKKVGEIIKQILSENPELPVIQAVGVACPGLIDDGVIRFSSQMKWTDVPAVEIIQKYTGINDIFIDNEVKAHGMAEDMFGLAKGYRNSVVLTMGSGIGSSILINHKLYRGRLNMAGEIGHICINPSGNMCECGKRGCLQTYMADWAILREARMVQEDITLDGVFEAYTEGKVWAVSLIDRVMEYLSITVSILANTYSPDIIILCGRLLEDHVVFRDLVESRYRGATKDYMLDTFRVQVSDLGPDGTVVGAGTLAYYNMLDKIL
ncbi:ROK family transcriptional regulator [Caproiciproducens sp.]|uniref:ROK family transcriptional regulator n=1 Tax=Caproiciproducens sp. TaxID=1954376 RepID=UPI002898E9EF|nr:ROK family transcriptional regulator [Caproiciproducens sp.]